MDLSSGPTKGHMTIETHFMDVRPLPYLNFGHLFGHERTSTFTQAINYENLTWRVTPNLALPQLWLTSR